MIIGIGGVPPGVQWTKKVAPILYFLKFQFYIFDFWISKIYFSNFFCKILFLKKNLYCVISIMPFSLILRCYLRLFFLKLRNYSFWLRKWLEKALKSFLELLVINWGYI